MKHIVVLGSSQAGVSAIDRIRERSKDYAFTIISLDGSFPANRDKFAQLIAKNIKPSELLVRDKKYFDANGINLVLDQRIDRVNFNRRVIFTESKEQIGYDILLICDFPADQWPDIKGTNKQGIFSLSKGKTVLDAHETLPIAEAVVIESDRPEGLLLALGYVANNKDVSLITRKETLLPGYFSKEVSDQLICALAERGLNIYTSNEIAEILGEGEAKAVRLKTNKVLASDITYFADVLPDPKFVKQSSLALSERITVDACQRTNVNDVYALDLACVSPGAMRGKFKSSAVLELEGLKAACAILGEEAPVIEPVASRSVQSCAMNAVFFGDASLGADARESFDAQNFIYKRLIHAKGKPSAAVLLNADDKSIVFEKILKGQAEAGEIESEFGAAIGSSADVQAISEGQRIESQHAGPSQPA
jgi:nitrite reductase (NADH) large subunit